MPSFPGLFGMSLALQLMVVTPTLHVPLEAKKLLEVAPLSAVQSATWPSDSPLGVSVGVTVGN